MTSIYFPIAALFISALLNILYFTRANVNNKETKIYRILLILNFIHSFLDCFIIILIKELKIVIPFLNKIDIILIMIWLSGIFVYIAMISYDIKKYKRFVSAIIGVDILVSIIICILPFTLINEGEILNTIGPATNLTYLFCFLYIINCIIAVLYSVITKHKKLNFSKYAPIYTLLFFMVISLFIRNYLPNVIIEPFMISFVNLIMYFTIENPDVKMLREVELAKEQAEKSNQVKSDFISSMSHEIRTPLNAIVGFSTLIDSADTLEEAKENAKDIIDASNTLLNMISNVLDISLVEASSIELKEVEYDPTNLIYEVANLFQYKIKEKNLDFNIKIGNVPNTIIGDEAKVKRIVANLLDNAVKYTEKGSVKISLDSEIVGHKCLLKIEVEDTGIGLNEEVQAHLFENFRRAEKNRDSSISGMGLGLSITKKLVEMLHGKICYETKENSGTTFKVTIEQRKE